MEDSGIVELYWRRDESAIRESERKYGKYLLKIAGNILSGLEDSRECVNETYWKAWSSMPPHKPSVLSTYLGKITRQLSIDLYRKRNREKRKIWWKWGALAACVCAVVLGAVWARSMGGADRPVLQWSEGFAAADYFAYNDDAGDTVSSSSDSLAPYAQSRSFSDDRARMEADGVIPLMTEHPLFDCWVGYKEDGSIYSITLSWHRRDVEGLEHYSDLTITAGCQEVEIAKCMIGVEVDENGNIIPDAVTVTERDGVSIIAEGNENRNKTLTFRNEHGWYQIEGSWNDSYEDMAYLLDWVWEHPLDFSRFPMEQGDKLASTDLGQYPDAFQMYRPDFEAAGYTLDANFVLLKNGEPYRFEGHYLKDNVEQGVGGETEIHWCIDTEPDCYDLQDCLGKLDGLTEERIADTLAEESSFAFLWDDCFIRVYTKSPQEVWAVLKPLIK